MKLALELFISGFIASVFGSMVGLGGGFILVPLLRLFFGLAPAEAAGTSLVLVVANSGSGALTYLLQKRVDIRLGLWIAAGGFPGSILGAILSRHISATLFDAIFGVLLVGVAIDMIINAERRVGNRIEREDISKHKHMSYRLSVLVGFIVGLVSSLFGIGGGVVIVPSLLYFSELPAHAISATSHFGIVLTSPVGLVTHGLEHDVDLGYALPLVIGGLLGGPIGARLSLRLKSRRLMLFVGAALIIAAGSLALRHILR